MSCGKDREYENKQSIEKRKNDIIERNSVTGIDSNAKSNNEGTNQFGPRKSFGSKELLHENKKYTQRLQCPKYFEYQRSRPIN